MRRKNFLLTTALVALPLLPGHALADPLPLVQAVDHEVIASSRVGRAAFEYRLEITFTNSGSDDATSITFAPVSSAAGTQIISNSLSFAELDSGETEVATGTLVIRQDRRARFDLSMKKPQSEFL